MELDIKTQAEVDPINLLSIGEFIKQHHPTLTYPAIAYAIKHNKIDAYKDGRKWVIKLNETTLKYNPIRATKSGRNQ